MPCADLPHLSGSWTRCVCISLAIRDSATDSLNFGAEMLLEPIGMDNFICLSAGPGISSPCVKM